MRNWLILRLRYLSMDMDRNPRAYFGRVRVYPALREARERTVEGSVASSSRGMSSSRSLFVHGSKTGAGVVQDIFSACPPFLIGLTSIRSTETRSRSLYLSFTEDQRQKRFARLVSSAWRATSSAPSTHVRILLKGLRSAFPRTSLRRPSSKPNVYFRTSKNQCAGKKYGCVN